MSANIWFFGTGHFAARCLREIARAYPPALVVTAPPSVAGRGLITKLSPVEDSLCLCVIPSRSTATKS